MLFRSQQDHCALYPFIGKLLGSGRFADRVYIYGNSVDDAPAQLLFRTSEGNIIKQYGEINPWVREILSQIELKPATGRQT